MRIGVDVCVGKRGVFMLQRAGHKVLEAEHGEMDRVWLERARNEGVELLVSVDADVEIYAYDHNIAFVRAKQSENGVDLADRVISFAASAMKG